MFHSNALNSLVLFLLLLFLVALADASPITVTGSDYYEEKRVAFLYPPFTIEESSREYLGQWNPNHRNSDLDTTKQESSSHHKISDWMPEKYANSFLHFVATPDDVRQETIDYEELIRGGTTNEYISIEVMNSEQYANIQCLCIDKDEYCAAYAASGKCENKFDNELYTYMMTNCAPACQTCDILHMIVGSCSSTTTSTLDEEDHSLEEEGRGKQDGTIQSVLVEQEQEEQFGKGLIILSNLTHVLYTSNRPHDALQSL